MPLPHYPFARPVIAVYMPLHLTSFSRIKAWIGQSKIICVYNSVPVTELEDLQK